MPPMTLLSPLELWGDLNGPWTVSEPTRPLKGSGKSYEHFSEPSQDVWGSILVLGPFLNPPELWRASPIPLRTFLSPLKLQEVDQGLETGSDPFRALEGLVSAHNHLFEPYREVEGCIKI